MKNILITGANGFIGSFLVEEAIRKGYKVYAAVRRNSDLSQIRDLDIEFIYPNLSDQQALKDFFEEQKDLGLTFNYILHNAGATKVSKKEDYFKINTGLTKNLVNALIESNCIPEKFLLMSSLAACGPGDPNSLQPIHIDQVSKPLTSYAKSKLEAEKFLETAGNFPWIALKPTTVYGPREKDLLVFMKMINKGFEGYIGLKEQHLSFIYVKDLARAAITALESSILHKKYLVADGCSYTNHQLGEMIRERLNKKTFRIRVPLFIAHLAAWFSETGEKIKGNFPIFNKEKMNELSSINWLCDSNPSRNELDFFPHYNLNSGLTETIEWYLEHKWL